MTAPLSFQLPPQCRAFALDRSTLDENERTIPLSFSSESPVLRTLPPEWPDKAIAGKRVNEILSHDEGACDLSRLRALCVDHDLRQQIGAIQDARIEGKRGVGHAKFSRSASGEKELQDVRDGIRADVSVGYKIHKYRVEPGASKDEPLTLRVLKWQPFEVSVLAVGADGSIGLGRAVDTTELDECTAERSADFTTDPAPTITVMSTAAAPTDADRETYRKEELKRQQEIRAVGSHYARHPKIQELVTRALDAGTGSDELKRQAFELVMGDSAKPIETNPNLGLTRKETEKYSLLRALRCFAERKPLEGLELECSRAMETLTGRSTNGFFIPNDIAFAGRSDMEGRRDLNVTSATQGGNLVQTDVLGGSMIEYLRNKQVVRRLGATSLDGLVGHCAIPRHTGIAVGYSVSEQGAPTESTQAIGQLTLTPKHVSAYTDFSVQLLAQSSIDVENFARTDLMKALAQATDSLALTGTGSSNQPTGITNTAGVGSVTFGAAATLAKIVDFETQVANANADLGSLAYITSPSARGKLKVAPKIGSTYPIFIWEDANGIPNAMPGDGKMNGYLSVATKNATSDVMIFGNWEDLIIAGWAGLEVINDPYTGALTGTIRIVVRQMIDIGVRHAGSFTVSSDSAAQ